MAGPRGEAANGYKVYQQTQAAKKPVAATAPNHVYENPNAVAQGQKNKDYVYADQTQGKQDAFNRLYQNGLVDKWGRPGPQAPVAPTGYGPSGGRGRGGGGGGGGAATPAGPFDSSPYNFDPSPYKFDGAPFDALQASLQSGVSADQASANTAYDQLDQHLANLQNPYAHIQPAQAAQVDPTQLSALIQSQGGGDAGLRAQAQFLQAQNGSQAAASDRLAQMLSANQQAYNQGTQSAAQQGRVGAQGDLMAQYNAMKARLDAQKLSAQQQMDRQRLQAQAGNDHARMVAQAAYNERNPA